MCGRYSLVTPFDGVAEAFGVADPPPLTPRYNVAPSQVVAVVGLKPDGVRRGVALLKWGLVPHWSDTANPKVKPINVRAESAGWKFGELLRRRRCLIPADGFYEWAARGGRKVPHRFTVGGGVPFGLAGLWDVWEGEDGTKLRTCAILTTTANEVVRPVHDRMPVILPAEAYAAWLDPGTPDRAVAGLLRPYPADGMAVSEAGAAVNSPKHDGPDCLTPAA